jgi:hypothetical protein
MTPKTLIAGIAVAAMTAAASQALAASHSGGAYAEPSQPIAYSSLGAYMKASPTAKRTRDWSGGTAVAASSAGSNVSATTPAASNAGSMPMSTQTQKPDANVSDTPPTVSPQADTAPTQPPLNQTSGATNAQPPASNAPVTTDTPGAAMTPAAPQ